MPSYTEVITNDCIDTANFEIIFYGPCSNPGIYIGDNEYTVYVDLVDGEYLVIDSKTKTIFKYMQYTTPENVFYLRDKDSYIFERIPHGTIGITRNKTLKVDVSIFDERGEPEWI